MDTNAKKNDIVRIRTFAEDVANIRASLPKDKSPKKSEESAAPSNIYMSTPLKSKAPTPVPKAEPKKLIEPIKALPKAPKADDKPPTHFVKAEEPVKATIVKQIPKPPPPSQLEASVPMIPNEEIVTKNISAHKESILTTEDDIFDIKSHEGSDGSSGSIITDTKRKRFRLFPAILESIKTWFSTKRKAIHATKPKPNVVVADSKERASIIKDAGAKSAIAPRDDYAEITERLREVPRDNTPRNLEIIETKKLPVPSWTHTDKAVEPAIPQVPVPPAPEATPVDPVPQPKTTPTLTQPEFAPIPEVVIPEPEPIPPSAPIEAPENLPVAPGADPAPVEPPANPTPEAIVEVPVPEVAAATARPTTPRYRATPATTSGPGPLLFVVVVVIAIILGVGSTVWWFGTKSVTPTNFSVIEIPSIITADIQTPIALPSSGLALLQNLESIATPSGIVQLYPTTKDDEGSEVAASAGNIIDILTPQAQGSFLRDVKAIAFGKLDGTSPFVVLKTSSFDTALSGMLSWETTMSSDLAPFFGEPVIEPSAQTTRSAGQIQNAFFTDTLISNKDVRLLFDDTKQERLMYSFIDRNTILITTNREAFTRLVPLVK